MTMRTIEDDKSSAKSESSDHTDSSKTSRAELNNRNHSNPASSGERLHCGQSARWWLVIGDWVEDCQNRGILRSERVSFTCTFLWTHCLASSLSHSHSPTHWHNHNIIKISTPLPFPCFIHIHSLRGQLGHALMLGSPFYHYFTLKRHPKTRSLFIIFILTPF